VFEPGLPVSFRYVFVNALAELARIGRNVESLRLALELDAVNGPSHANCLLIACDECYMGMTGRGELIIRHPQRACVGQGRCACCVARALDPHVEPAVSDRLHSGRG
jgi:hypothetical protein